jgi:hypothetical protein
MFNWIWENRPNYSELSDKPLYNKLHPQWHHQFAHILNKGSYPKWKLNPDNIMLMLPEEHEKQERFPSFRAKHDELKRKYYEEFYNKKF